MVWYVCDIYIMLLTDILLNDEMVWEVSFKNVVISGVLKQFIEV